MAIGWTERWRVTLRATRYVLKAIAYAPKSSAETERATATPRAKFVRLESA